MAEQRLVGAGGAGVVFEDKRIVNAGIFRNIKSESAVQAYEM